MCAKVIRIAEGTGFSGWVRLLVVTLLILACKPPASFAAQGAGQDVLSPGEKEWLKAHQCISLAPGRNVAPIGYLDEEGTYRGIAAEYLSLIASRFDLHFEMVPAGNHRQSAEGANKVEADLFGAASESSRLSECLLFTIPFEEFPSVIVVRNDVRKALTLEELAGSSVAIVSGSAAYDYMASNYPALKLIGVSTVEEGLERVSFGLAEAFVENLASAAFHIEKKGFANLRIAGNTGYVHRISFACRKGSPELIGILEKGLGGISQGERQAILKNWVNSQGNTPRTGLPALIVLVFGAIGFLLTGMFFWNWFLRSQVTRRSDQLTRELAERTKAEQELQEAHNALEQRVESRTVQLSTANERLQMEIFEREKIEEALRESEERYRQAFNGNLSVQYLYDAGNGLIVDANEAACHYYGYSHEEITALKIFDLSASSEDQTCERIAGILSGRCFRTELRQRLSTGETRDVEVYSGRITVGGRTFVHSIIHDISDRKRFETALHQSEERFRTAAECASDLIYEWDLRTNFLEWFGCVDELLGYAQGEFPRTLDAWEGALHSDDHDRVMAEVEQHLKTRMPFCMEYRIVRKNGAILYWTDCRKILRDEKGRYSKWIGVTTDITSRKKVEEELQAARQQYMDIIEFLPDATFVIDRESKVIAWNRAIEEMTGLPKQDILGRGRFAYSVPFYGKLRPVLIDKVLQPDIDTGIYYDLLVRKADALYTEVFTPELYEGKGAYVWANASPLFDAKGNLIGAIQSIRDVTDRKKMEEELLRARKLESVGILAGGIAHDFNNLLGIILGNISLAQANPKPGGYLSKLLKATEKACYRAKNLTQQLLTFSHGGEPLRRPEFIQEIVKEAANMALAGSAVEWVFHTNEDPWPVDCDSGQIHQVVTNLMINAKEAMPQGGIVDISLVNEEIGPEKIAPLKKGNYVRLSVRDLGMGIPADLVPKIFDPYFSTKQRGTQKGMGLGLSTVYSIIKKHGGYIAVESEVAAGTVFHIYLPASDGKPCQPPHEETVPEPCQSIVEAKVLLMDDEEPIRNMTGEMLCHLGCEAAFARDGSEAIKKFLRAKQSGRPFDLVILDLTVRAGMGGGKAIEELLKIDPSLKAIASSGYSTDPVMSNFRQYGFSGILVKPYNVTDLSVAIRTAVSQGT